MTTYILVDSANLFHRLKHGSGMAPDSSSQIGLAMHLVFTSVRKLWRDFGADHVVFGLEGKSWRRDFYKPYKAHRREANAKKSESELAEDQAFFQAIDDFSEFLTLKTNCTVLRHPRAEGDDMIARFLQLHPQDSHVVVSSDSDFLQLLAPNVQIYNGITGMLYSLNGVIDKDGKPARSKGQLMATPDPEWLLFEKIIRGDPGDNVMSAFPGVRKTRMIDAYNNRHAQGYAWNNLMLSTWTDHLGEEHRVRDVYERNQILIDLTAQPLELIEAFDESIRDGVNRAARTQVGINLIKFASRWGLVKIEQNVSDYSPCFSSQYRGPLLKNADDI
jgi:hypothetical protein